MTRMYPGQWGSLVPYHVTEDGRGSILPRRPHDPTRAARFHPRAFLALRGTRDNPATCLESPRDARQREIAGPRSRQRRGGGFARGGQTREQGGVGQGEHSGGQRRAFRWASRKTRRFTPGRATARFPYRPASGPLGERPDRTSEHPGRLVGHCPRRAAAQHFEHSSSDSRTCGATTLR
jgi:hypothetical protein